MLFFVAEYQPKYKMMTIKNELRKPETTAKPTSSVEARIQKSLGSIFPSFGAKEQAVAFPVWILMLYWMLGHSLKDRKIWIQVAPFFVMSLAFGYITMLSQAANGGGFLSNASSYPLWQRFILGCYSFVEYFVKCTIPYHLMYLYPFPMIIGEPLPTWMLLYPAMFFIVIATLSKYLKRMPLSIGLSFFLIHIAVALHIIPLSRFAVIADRYVYLASIGITFIIAWYVVRFLATKKGAVRKTAIRCFACVAIGLIAYSNIRSRDWKDTDSIKRELRELLKKRHDYVAPTLEKLTNDEDDAKEEEAEEATDEKSEASNRDENDNKEKAHIESIIYSITY